MKLMDDKIWTTNSSAGRVTLEAFRQHPLAETPAAKLFFLLLEENTWSTDFEVSVHAHSEPNSIIISTPFPLNVYGSRVIEFEEVDGRLPTIQEIAGRLVTEMNQYSSALTVTMATLGENVAQVRRKAEVVTIELARKLILAKAPTADLRNCAEWQEDCILFDDGARRTLFVKEPDIFGENPQVFEILQPLAALQEDSSNMGTLCDQISAAQPI